MSKNNPPPKQNSTREQFVAKALKRHGPDKHDYQYVVYFDSMTPVKIYCNACHEIFEQVPKYHIQGCGCSNCFGKKKFSTEEFIAKAIAKHGPDAYGYQFVEYQNYMKHVKIFCNTCQKIFEQAPSHHLAGSGCAECGGTAKVDPEVFLNRCMELNGDAFDYSNTRYEGVHKKIEIFCNNCKKYFWQNAGSHLHQGCGCPNCLSIGYSKAQIEWLNSFDLNIQHKLNGGEHKVKNSTYKADGYIEKLNIVFEFQGCYFHGCLKCYPNQDKINPKNNKTYKELNENTQKKRDHYVQEGYHLIEIYEHEWTKIKKDPEQLKEHQKTITLSVLAIFFKKKSDDEFLDYIKERCGDNNHEKIFECIKDILNIE